MYKIGYLGNFEKVPQIVEYILNSDIENLEKELKNGWDINKEIFIEEFAIIAPLKIALQCNNEKVINWLMEKGADVKTKKDDWVTHISNAGRFCSPEICELLIKHGELEN